MILLDRATDCTKLTLDAGRMGYTAGQLAEILRSHQIEPECVGGGKVVLMFSPQTPAEDEKRLLRFAEQLPLREPIPYPDFYLAPERVLPLREAAFAPSVTVPVEQAVGKIAAENRIACPPGIPIVTAGEKVGEIEKNLLLDSGIFMLSVIK
jgi:arginine/lysine/ornithine decarboxylase